MAEVKVWKCDVCGYIHEGEFPPEQCPVCGVGPENFSLMEAVVSEPVPAVSAWVCTICGNVHAGDAPPALCPLCAADASAFEPQGAATTPGTTSATAADIVIVGAGIAGMTAAEHARKQAPDAKITLLSKEAGPPYYRLNLTRLLAGEVDEESLVLKPERWFADNRIELREAEVAAIDSAGHKLTLADGATLVYDRLILANGAHPFIPPIPGAERPGVHVLRSLDDVRMLLAEIGDGTRCVCIGGGVLGLEAAGALAKHGLDITVLEGFDWLLPRQLAQPGGNLLSGHIANLGMKVRCGVRVKALTGGDRVAGVELSDGELIPADMVVLATGVRPNTHLARQCGVDVGHGVLVSDRMVTSEADIYAAGDVSEHRGVVYGIWPASYAQGVVAGTNAAGGSVEFRGLPPSNQLKVLDVPVFSIGEFTATDGSFSLWERADATSYRRLLGRDGRLVGANLYGDIGLAGPIRDAIESGKHLRELPELVALMPELAGLFS